jgi:hypothetical protein
MPYTYPDLIADLQFKSAFATTDSDRQALITQYLAESECAIVNEAWSQRCPDTFRTKAIFLLTAHRLAQYDRISSAPVNASGFVDTSQVQTGYVASMAVAVGSNSVSFTQPDSDKVGGRWGDWVDTVWGLQLIEIVSRYKMRGTGFVA